MKHARAVSFFGSVYGNPYVTTSFHPTPTPSTSILHPIAFLAVIELAYNSYENAGNACTHRRNVFGPALKMARRSRSPQPGSISNARRLPLTGIGRTEAKQGVSVGARRKRKLSQKWREEKNSFLFGDRRNNEKVIPILS
ncbi:hypothetical protein Trydic_g8700 [Trypoxylus dichotomus]